MIDYELELALEQDVFEGMIEKYGRDKLERMIRQLPSYKSYDYRYPKEKYVAIQSLDVLEDSGYAIESDGEKPDETAVSNELVEAFRKTLNARQIFILDNLKAGYTQPEIAVFLGHKNTAIVRVQKHLAKQKWLALVKSEHGSAGLD